ncbi:MAG: lycopene cyclase domain-containing protein [Patescibacteria group bacterium]
MSISLTWFFWSVALLVVWLVVYLSLHRKASRKEMLIVSLWTSLFGLTEPLFVPEYWDPQSLFDLAARTGFDIESLLFAFGIGGLATVIYERIFRVGHRPLSSAEKHHARHRYHRVILLIAPVLFFLLLFFTHLNPIYVTMIALFGGGLATWYCRPDLKKKMFTSAVIFTLLYTVYFLSLIAFSPGYVETVWNLEVLSGVLLLGIPLEELGFAFTLGFMWSSVYEHIRWETLVEIDSKNI